MDVELGQRVALKFLQPGKAGMSEQRERFLRELSAEGARGDPLNSSLEQEQGVR